MRKFLLYLALFIFAFQNIKAQVKDNLSFGPIAGFGHSWNNVQYNARVKKFNPSFEGGARLTYSVVPHIGFSVDALFKTEGYKLEDQGFSFISHLNYINIDPKAWYFFGKAGNAFHPKIGIGPNFGFLVGGKRKEKILYAESGVSKSKDYYNTFNFSVSGAAGFNYRLKNKVWLNVDAVYNHGLTDLVKPIYGGGIKTRSLFLNVGVTFGIGHLKTKN